MAWRATAGAKMHLISRNGNENEMDRKGGIKIEAARANMRIAAGDRFCPRAYTPNRGEMLKKFKWTRIPMIWRAASSD